MFLKNVTINSYKSIQKATASFEDGSNIIIGKNGSGKSNLLEFIYNFIYFLTVNAKKRHSIYNNLEYTYTICDKTSLDIIELIFTQNKNARSLSERNSNYNRINLSKKIGNRFLYSEEQLDAIRNIAPNDLKIINDLDKLFISFKVPDSSYWLDKAYGFELEHEHELQSNIKDYYDGFEIFFKLIVAFESKFPKQEAINSGKIANVYFVKVIETIFKDFNEKFQLNHNLSKFSPIQEIRINPNINIYPLDNKILVENLLLDFRVNDNWVPWSYLSDGTKRLFYLITQCLSLEEGLILIEEPELGIHPHQLFKLMTFLKEQSEEKQIIISSHSPIVLDILNPHELNRITIAKMESTGSQFYKLTDKQQALPREYMQDVADLSDYWVHSDLENNDTDNHD